jgi:F-type H+-transporting ATPase subunit b
MDEILKDVSAFVSECLGPLGNSGNILTWLRDFTIQLIATLILFLVVRFFLWKPLTNFLEVHRDKMDKELKETEEARERAIKLEEDLKAKYAAAKDDIQKLLKQAEAEGSLRREEIIKEAKNEATRLISMANDDIKRQVAEQEKDIKNQIISIAFLAAEVIVGKEIDQDKYLEAVTKIIESGMNNE